MSFSLAPRVSGRDPSVGSASPFVDVTPPPSAVSPSHKTLGEVVADLNVRAARLYPDSPPYNLHTDTRELFLAAQFSKGLQAIISPDFSGGYVQARSALQAHANVFFTNIAKHSTFLEMLSRYDNPINNGSPLKMVSKFSEYFGIIRDVALQCEADTTKALSAYGLSGKRLLDLSSIQTLNSLKAQAQIMLPIYEKLHEIYRHDDIIPQLPIKNN